ncbi:MAG: nitroreductase [Alphaproteobacteria bacterium]|nr:nitroreductase [Alphaproteobacteria bacterium]MBU6471154.1 nitroreductase [Alphaproteobacteria bacterium]MDE2013109.1 nitroreductase [Alphaproteobacteria bacterium]MDE2074404.1 nitroreductase [Alphaproteobacteria bacterium]MDE2351929.1 nitroreductase [Alphaproteobacteria bacterium]
MNDNPSLNRPAPQTLDLLLSRRSGSAKTMSGPGPDGEELRTILAAGARVPDHGKLAPWRFIVFEGEGRERMGEVLVKALAASEPNASPARVEQERTRFLRAPLIVAVISSARELIPIPVWEQELSAGAVCQNMLLAAHAMGYVGQWVSEWCAYDPFVKNAIGLKAGERVAGYLYFGQPAEPLEERPRPSLEALVTRF